MPSLLAVRWVGQNSGPIFRRLWTKVHRIKRACARVSVVCNVVFRLTMSCCLPEIFASKSRSYPKSRRNFEVFGLPNFGETGNPNFLPNFINLGHQSPSNTWHRLVTIGQATSEILRRKKKDLNDSGKTE